MFRDGGPRPPPGMLLLFLPLLLTEVINPAGAGVPSPFCPSSYTQRGSTCYHYETTGRAFTSTSSYCSGVGSGTMAQARDPTELEAFAQITAGNAVWLNARGATGAPLTWLNLHSTLGNVNKLAKGDLSEWANSSVPARGTSDDCLSLPRFTARACSDSKRNLCVKAADAGCPAGFLRFGSACVYGSMAPATFADARASCTSLNSELYEPREWGLIAHVRDMVAVLRNGDHWVGLEEKYPGDYRFVSDHSTPMFTFFEADSGTGPVVDTASQGSCVKMADDGRLLTGNCNDKKHFLCLLKPRPLCPAGYVSFGESSECFYQMPRSGVIRSDAAQRCVAVGGVLGDIREVETRDRFNSWHGNVASLLWTGVTDLAEDGKFTTSDGLVPAWLKWRSGEGGDATRTCTTLDRTEMLDYGCASSIDGYLCLHVPAPGRCPSGFLELAGRCYRFSPNTATHADASATCLKLAASLASVDTNETAALLSSVRLWDAESFGWYVGLTRDTADPDRWLNYDRTMPLPDVWDTAPATGQDCAVLAATTGKRLLTPVACTETRKFICEWQPDLVNQAGPLIEPAGACFLDKPYGSDPDFRVSPGDYDPTKLNPSLCQARCQSLSFMYAGLKNGMFCFCSQVLRIELVASTLCAKKCTGDAAQTCGGDGEYVQVYRTGGQAEIKGTSMSVDQTTIQPVDTLFSMTAGALVGEQVLISYDFGDGSDATAPSVDATGISYQYSMPGNYTITAIFTDMPGIAKPRFQQTSVTVGEEVGQVELDCPDLTEPGEEISCLLWLVTGSQLKLTLEMDKGFVDPQEYTIPDPAVSALGYPPPQHATAEMKTVAPTFTMGEHGDARRRKRSTEIRYGSPLDSKTHSSGLVAGVSVDTAAAPGAATGVQGSSHEAKTVIMPWAKITDPVVLVGFEYYATKPGNLKLVVFRPTCPGRTFCHSSNTCDDGVCDDVDASTVQCSSPLHAQLRQCQDSLCGIATTVAAGDSTPTEATTAATAESVADTAVFADLTFTTEASHDGNTTASTDAPASDTSSGGGGSAQFAPPSGSFGYQAVYSVSEEVAAAGYGKLLVDSSLHTATWLQPGDVIGYMSEGAVIGWRPSRSGEDPELASAGGSWLGSDSSGAVDSRHYLRAIVSSPLQLTINHTYDVVGAYQVFATVATTGDIVSESSAGQAVDVQVPISGFRVTMDPEHVTTNNKTNATLYIKTGSFVKITFNFGEVHLGGANVVENVDVIEDDAWSQIYWYKRGDPGPRYVIISAENKWGREQFRHTLYVQRPVTDKWYLVDNAPVLWPIPGDVNFTVVYPAGLLLPTMASAQLFTGDGYVFEWEIPEEREAGEIYEIGFNRSYDIQGSYRARLRIFNLASEFEMRNRVPVWAEIKNLTTMAYYLPFLPVGGDEYRVGHGPDYDSFPIERNVSFFLNMTQGMIFQYILEMDNGTFLTNSSTSPVNYIFPEPGTYSVSLYGWNPLQGRSIPVNITVKVLVSPVNVIIDDYLLVSEAKSAKEFEIRMDSIGTYTCLMWNPGDGSRIQGFGDRDTCDSQVPPVPYIYVSQIENPMRMKWTYMRKGEYKMSVHAFNFLSESRYELKFTVSSIPCRPPDLMIRDSSTAFWMPKEYFRKDSFELFTVCSIDCNASLDTTKTWTAEAIDESWGNITGSVDLTSLTSYQKSTLFVPGRFMEYGTYKMTYTIQISGEGMDPTQPFIKRVFTYIKIKRSPLLVTMVAGGSSVIQRGYNQMVLLEPERYSMDPDYPDDKNLQYMWFCRRLPDETLPRTRSGWFKPTEPLQNPIMNATAELYDWVYDNVTNATYEVERPDLGGCFGQGPGMVNLTTGRLYLNTLQFRTNNVTYEISVQMSKADPTDPRKATGTTLVDVVAGSPPIVNVKCQVADMCRVTESGSIINPSSRVALVGTCEDLCDGRLSWTWRVFYVRNFTEYRIKDGDRYIIGAGKPSVAVKKDLYSDYSDVVEFRIKVSVTRLADGEAGVATMYLLLNQAPTGGTCSVTPPEGRVVNLKAHGISATDFHTDTAAVDGNATTTTVAPTVLAELPIPGRALTEDWYVECVDFKDPDKDKIGKYVFFIKHPIEGFTRIMKFGKDRKGKFVFPYGPWELWVTITDNYDASRDIFIEDIMTSLPTKGEYAAWELKKDVMRAMGEGDQPRLSQLLTARSTMADIELPDDPTEATTTPAYEYDEEVETETMDPEELLEIQAEQERQRMDALNNKATENREMLGQLDNLNQNTLDDCTMVLSTTGAIVGDGKAVDSVGKDAAIGAIGGTCLQSVLLNGTLNDPRQAAGMVTSSLGSVTAVGKGIDNTNLNGELVPSDLASARRRRSTDYPEYELCEEGEDGEPVTPDPEDPEAIPCKTAKELALLEQKRKAATQVPTMLESIKQMQDKLMSIALPGEDPFTLKTADGLEMTLVMMEGWALDGYRMRLGEAEYQFPSLCAVLHEEANCSAVYNMTVGLQAINWPTLLYTYGEGTDSVSKDSSNLQLKLVQQLPGTTELEQVPVYDLPSHQRVRITVPRGKKGEKPVLPEPTFVEPQPNAREIMVYHSFNVTKPYVAINVEVSVSRPDAQLVVFMKRGNKPNLTQYDWVWKVQLPVNFTVDVAQEPMEEPIPITTAVPLTTIRVPTCEELEGVNATHGTNQTCIPGATTEPTVVCEEDLITYGPTTPAPTTESGAVRLMGLEATTTTSPLDANFTRQCTPVVVTASPTDGLMPDAEPVEPTNYISEYVRLTVVPNRKLEPYDPYGNDTLLYSYPLYDIFVPDWYVDNMTGEYWIGVAEFSNTTDDEMFFDDPSAVNLTFSNMTHVYSTNYTVRVYTSGCLFYNTLSDSWDSDGCSVIDSNHKATMCTCNHLTSFGSGFFVMPNAIDFDYVFANAGFEDNLSIYLTLIISFAIYLILMFWARWKDKKDVQQVGATPLPDNNPNHKYLYELLVITGNKTNSECDSKVQFILSGERDETEVRTIADPNRPILRRSATDSFVLAAPRPLGQLSYLRIWHDNSGKSGAASWYLNFIVVRDVQTGEKWQFIANKWFAVEEGDGQIDRLIPVAGREQMLQFQHLFNTTSRRNLSDGHLWFSVFMRPPRSRFTRVQRVSACMALLYLSMLVNAMWYGLVPQQPSTGSISFGPFSLSPEQIGVGVMANLIVFPPSFLIILLFRKSRPRHLKENRVEKAIEKQREEQRKSGKFPDEPVATETPRRVHSADSDTRSIGSESLTDTTAKKKKPFSLPWWCVFFAWFLTIASMGASIFFLWAYGITFGNEKTTKWLTSLIISFFSSVLLTQPIKVLLTAMLVSAVCKKLDDGHDDLDDDEKEPTLNNDEEWLHAAPPSKKKKERKIEYKPVDPAKIEAAKKERQKEVKMWEILQEMAAYAFFLWILLTISYGSRDPNCYLIRESLENGFLQPNDWWLSYKEVRNETRFWNWTRSVMLPELKIDVDYNGQKPSGKEKKYISDRVHLLLGNGVMRQVRIREKNTCRVPKMMRNVTRECHKFGNLLYEEHGDFGLGWNASLANKRPFNLKEYKYRKASSLDSYPFWGDLGWYGGGGYVVDLKGSRARLVSEMWRLQQQRWIDEKTRAVFIEFSLFNPQVNLFVDCTIVAEFSPDGGITPTFKFKPLRLLAYNSGFGLFVLVCDITFVIFIIYYNVREVKRAKKQKGEYLNDPWNYLELTVIVLGYTAIVFYLYRMFLANRIVDTYDKTKGRGYIKLQQVSYLDETFGYMVGFLVFFGTLKFIKLLRFNKRMGFLTSTLKQCAGDLWGFIIIFFVIFASFSFTFFLLFGFATEDFANIIMSVESSFAMMLGKFNFKEIQKANPILGPIMFFTFTISMTCIFVNIFLTIIIKSFQAVKSDLMKQSNEYEVVEFLVNRVKLLTGIGKAKLNTVGPLSATDGEDDAGKDPSAQFPEKVDQLLNHVNDFYFDGQMNLNNKAWLKKTLSKSNSVPMPTKPYSSSDDTPEQMELDQL